MNHMFRILTGVLLCYFLLNPANTHTLMLSLFDRNVNKKVCDKYNITENAS
jgi:hypothetical protein